MEDIPKGTKCSNCKKHKATIRWVGEGGMLAFTHGCWSPWCECCELKAQLEYAKELSASIPEKEKRLKDVICK